MRRDDTNSSGFKPRVLSPANDVPYIPSNYLNSSYGEKELRGFRSDSSIDLPPKSLPASQAVVCRHTERHAETHLSNL